MKGALDFPGSFKKQSEIKLKTSLLTESKEQHQNLKQAEIITHMRGFCLLLNTLLFMLKYLVISKKNIYSK